MDLSQINKAIYQQKKQSKEEDDKNLIHFLGNTYKNDRNNDNNTDDERTNEKSKKIYYPSGQEETEEFNNNKSNVNCDYSNNAPEKKEIDKYPTNQGKKIAEIKSSILKNYTVMIPSIKVDNSANPSIYNKPTVNHSLEVNREYLDSEKKSNNGFLKKSATFAKEYNYDKHSLPNSTINYENPKAFDFTKRIYNNYLIFHFRINKGF